MALTGFVFVLVFMFDSIHLSYIFDILVIALMLYLALLLPDKHIQLTERYWLT